MPCTIDHAALVADPDRFDALAHDPNRATWAFPWGEVHVVRNCPACGSTLARVLVLGEPEEMSTVHDGAPATLRRPGETG